MKNKLLFLALITLLALPLSTLAADAAQDHSAVAAEENSEALQRWQQMPLQSANSCARSISSSRRCRRKNSSSYASV